MTKTNPLDISTILAGALFDFAARLTVGDSITLGRSHDAGAAVDALKAFAADRGLSLDGARVADWNLAASAQRSDADDKLATLGALVFERYTDPNVGWGDLDGGDVQDLATRAGVFEPTPRVVPCGDSCLCAESAAPDETVTCMKFADGVAALAAWRARQARVGA